MMNIKQNKGLFALLLLAVLTACTSEDNITTSKQLIEVGGDKLKIVINEEPFDVETTTQTRAGGVAQSIPAGTIDLGDGLEAEVSISQGTPAPKTRATVVSNGHYNIYAYDTNTNQMLIGPNKKLSGNVVGGVFTPDAGSRLELEVGTYKFVCCTDGVNLDPTYGTGSLNLINAKKEMIGATEQTLLGDEQQLVFLMHHRESRFRFRLIGYTNQLTDVKAQIGVYTGSYRHNYIKVPTGFQGPSTSIGWFYYANEQPIQGTPERQSTAYPLANEFESDGYSYLSCVDCDLCFNLSGTIYGKTVNIQDKQLSLAHGVTLKDNGTYTINLKLKPTPALYLFEDGTCGALAEKGSRTPIAAVVKEKTNTEEGTAMALNVVSTSDTPMNFNKQKFSFADAVNDMNGYYYTWNSESTPNGDVKATTIMVGGLIPNVPAYEGFYQAAHYDPGVATTNVGKWYLPALGEWRLALKELGKVDIADMVPTWTIYGSSFVSWNKSVMEKVFTPVGGTALSGYPLRESSTAYDGFGLTYYLDIENNSISISSESHNYHPVVPFVHF